MIIMTNRINGPLMKESAEFGRYTIFRDGRCYDNGKKAFINKHLRKGKYILRLHLDENNEKKVTMVFVHRLLYSLFIDSSITRLDYVLPKDGNFKNIDLENLYRCPISLYRKQKLGNSGRKKVADQGKIDDIRHDRNINHMTFMELSMKYDISVYTIHKIIHGKYS